MEAYNVTDEQKRILRAIAEAYLRSPREEFYLTAGSTELRQGDVVVTTGVTAADLYALDDESLLKRWRQGDGGQYCKPTQSGLDAVLNNFRRPTPAPPIAIAEPPAIMESLGRFRGKYPDPSKVGFLMMKFGHTPSHERITQAVRGTLAKYGMAALRADEAEFNDDLYYNVATYMHGCGFGIAVFERLESDDFNPNVSLEVGYLRALRKPVCLMKDQTLKSLHTDLVGKLYRPFDPQEPLDSIPVALSAWLKDHGLID
jgi:nucleoside 2-deoxyribosyltransferase